MRYANHECYGCGSILPTSALKRVRDTVSAGTSIHRRKVNHSNTYLQTGRTERTSIRERFLCGGCRRKRFRRKVAGLADLGVGYAVLAFGGHHSTTATAVGTGSSDAQAVHNAPQRRNYGTGMLASLGSISRSVTRSVEHDAGVGDLASNPKVRFGAPNAVVQAVPADRSDYPACSATVTDHCVGK